MNSQRSGEFAQGKFISPEHFKFKRAPTGPAPVGNGGKDVLMLDNALAMVDNVVAMKLGV